MNSEACATCGTAIEHPAVTGIFCTRCHGEAVPSQGGWRSLLTGPLYVAAAAVVLPSVFNITVNGVNYVAIAGGAVALLAGAAGAVSASKAPPEAKSKKIGVALLVIVLALFRLVSSGILA